jgi:hypothetical protein
VEGVRRLSVIVAVAAGLTGCNSLLGIDDLTLASDAGVDARADASLIDGPAPEVQIEFTQGVNGYMEVVDTYLQSGGEANNAQHAKQTFEFETDDNRHALIRFGGLVGATSIPANATILTAKLQVVVDDEGTAGALHEVAIDWTSTVTYNSFGSTAGVQASEVGLRVTDTPSQVGTATLDVTASLVRWTSSTAPNFGWIFVPSDDNKVRMHSSEVADVAKRPTLIISYIP